MDESTSKPRRRTVASREAFVWLYVVALAVVAGGAWALITHGDAGRFEGCRRLQLGRQGPAAGDFIPSG